MKYRCEVCNSDMCFDGTTDETLPYDVACHETGDYHKGNLERLIQNHKCVHYMLRSCDSMGGYQCQECDKIFKSILSVEQNEKLRREEMSDQDIVNRLKQKIDDISQMHKRSECDVLDGIDMGLVILAHLEEILYGENEL